MDSEIQNGYLFSYLTYVTRQPKEMYRIVRNFEKEFRRFRLSEKKLDHFYYLCSLAGERAKTGVTLNLRKEYDVKIRNELNKLLREEFEEIKKELFSTSFKFQYKKPDSSFSEKGILSALISDMIQTESLRAIFTTTDGGASHQPTLQAIADGYFLDSGQREALSKGFDAAVDLILKTDELNVFFDTWVGWRYVEAFALPFPHYMTEDRAPIAKPWINAESSVWHCRFRIEEFIEPLKNGKSNIVKNYMLDIFGQSIPQDVEIQLFTKVRKNGDFVNQTIPLKFYKVGGTFRYCYIQAQVKQEIEYDTTPHDDGKPVFSTAEPHFVTLNRRPKAAEDPYGFNISDIDVHDEIVIETINLPAPH